MLAGIAIAPRSKVSLSVSVKLNKLFVFEGKNDAEYLKAWFFQLNQYISWICFCNKNVKAKFVSIVFVDYAAV